LTFHSLAFPEHQSLQEVLTGGVLGLAVGAAVVMLSPVAIIPLQNEHVLHATQVHFNDGSALFPIHHCLQEVSAAVTVGLFVGRRVGALDGGRVGLFVGRRVGAVPKGRR